MNIIDVILILPLALAVINGFRKGFIIEIASLVAFVLAILACLKLTHIFIAWVTPYTGSTRWVPFICYILMFVAVYLLVLWIGKMLETVVKIVQLGMLNRLAGVVFSLLKMCFFISLIFWLADMTRIIPKETENGSFTYKTLYHFAPKVISWLSDRTPWIRGEIEQIEHFFGGDKKTTYIIIKHDLSENVRLAFSFGNRNQDEAINTSFSVTSL